MRVLGVSGSLRRDSYNTALLRHAGDLFEAEGAEFEIYHGLRDIPPYDEDYDTDEAPEAVSRIREEVRDADAVFFVTPEYNSSIPGALKNALDWVSRPAHDGQLGARPVQGHPRAARARLGALPRCDVRGRDRRGRDLDRPA